jgi:hypothetical protein
MPRITGVSIAYQPTLGGFPIWRVKFELGGVERTLELTADDAIGARKLAAHRLGIPFSMC